MRDPSRAGRTEILTESYRRCRELNRVYGRSFFLATRLLPRWKQPHVHALYGFSRYTDDIVDAVTDESTVARADRLHGWAHCFAAGLAGHAAADPVLPAVLDTIELFALARTDFVAFLRSMEMDLSIIAYETYDDLLGYMEGSAAVIGTMMLPILTARRGRDGAIRWDHDLAPAREPARQLGLAFQLTNFIRDVAEDLDRGRIYLPLKDLAEFGLGPQDLHARVTTPAVRDMIAFEVDRAREHYRLAAPGIPMLAATSQACIRTACRVYAGILDEIAGRGYDVFRGRAVVPNRRRLAMTLTSLLTPPGRPVAVRAAR